MRLAFGDCVFDGVRRELTRAGQAQHLTPKAFALLELLLRERPRAIGKGELMQQLWADIVVSEGSLANLVTELRKAMLDGRGGRGYVKTLHGFGYAFRGEVRDLESGTGAASGVADGSLFQLLRDERAYALQPGENLIGRSAECEVCLDSTTVSRQHARLRVDADLIWLTDLDSKNGTLLNGDPVKGEPQRVSAGDRIQIGSVRLVLRAKSSGAATDTFAGDA